MMRSKEIECPICKKTFRRCFSLLKDIKTPTCSMKCLGELRKTTMCGDKNPHWKGGRAHRPDGRSMLYAPMHPGAKLSNGTYILEYRLIAEQIVGRRLYDNEVVHHINGDVTDNRSVNLEIITQAEHAKKHHTKNLYCMICGDKHKSNNYCSKHNQRFKKHGSPCLLINMVNKVLDINKEI